MLAGVNDRFNANVYRARSIKVELSAFISRFVVDTSASPLLVRQCSQALIE